jgi:hypothetical protein
MAQEAFGSLARHTDAIKKKHNVRRAIAKFSYPDNRVWSSPVVAG